MKLSKEIPEIMQELREQANTDQAFGKQFNTTESSDWYALNYPVATMIKYQLDMVQTRFDNLELSKAGDPYFFETASNFGFYRKNPAQALCVKFEAKAPMMGATAQIGELQFKKKGTDIIYANNKAVTVDAIPYFFTATASATGSDGNTAIGTVTEVVSTPQNWGSDFINVREFGGGQNLEGLEDARKRFFNQQSSSVSWITDGIYSALIPLSGVQSVAIFQNRSDVTVKNIPRRAIHVIVQGGVDEEIWQVLYEKVLPATFMHGNKVSTIKDLSGEEIEVAFDRPTLTNIFYKIDLMPMPTAIPTELYTLTEDAINDTKISSIISSDEIACNIKEKSSIAREYDSFSISFCKTDLGTYLQAIKLDYAEVANAIKAT